jgi:glucokinase
MDNFPTSSSYQLDFFTQWLYNFYGDLFLIFFVGGFVFLLGLLFYRWWRSKGL